MTKFRMGKYFVPPRKNRISDRKINGLGVIKSNSRELFLILKHSFKKYFYESVGKKASPKRILMVHPNMS